MRILENGFQVIGIQENSNLGQWKSRKMGIRETVSGKWDSGKLKFGKVVEYPKYTL